MPECRCLIPFIARTGEVRGGAELSDAEPVGDEPLAQQSGSGLSPTQRWWPRRLRRSTSVSMLTFHWSLGGYWVISVITSAAS